MLDWLAIWGVYTVAGFVFTEVLAPLAKGALEDYVKDFFKDSIKDFTGLFQKDTLQTVVGKALKEFLQLVQQELEDAELSEEELEAYTKPLNQFINDKSVKEILGSAFQSNCKAVDTKRLAKIWYQLDLLSLPKGFDWEQVGKRYLKKVKALIRETDELRAILDSQNLESIQQNTQEIAGISPGFDLKRYQEGLQERYGNLNLDSLDTTVYDYREKLKVWQVFTAQNVRECQNFLPQVYEIPKEHQKRLRESNELDAEVDLQEWERYKKVYYQQPVRSVLDVVNDSQNYPYIVILGDPGSGKSTLLQYIALNWARSPLSSVIEQPIPLLKLVRDWKDDPETLSIVKTRAESDEYLLVRQAALQEVAKGWKDNPNTLSWLKARAQSDESSVVRLEAVRQVAKGWTDDCNTLPWLKTRAQFDKSLTVQQEATQELAKAWKDEPGIFELLYRRAVNVSSENEFFFRDSPRQAALEVIIEYYPDYPQTFPLLHNLAENDPDEQVRWFVMQELAKGWKNELGVFELLYNRAVNTISEHRNYLFGYLREDSPRQLALEIIIKQYRDHSQTLPLLRDRAENDPDEKVREFAKKKLEQLERQN